MEQQLLSKLDLRSLIRDVIRQWWVILLLTASVGLLSYVYQAYRYVPSYTTSATLVVSDRSNAIRNYNNLDSAAKTAERFSTVLNGQLLQKAVMEELELDSFPATTRVAQVSNTNMIEMSVTAGSPELAFRIMQCILDNYADISDYVVGTVSIEVLQPPMVADAPGNPLDYRRPVRRNMLMALLALTALVAVQSYARRTVKNVDQYKTDVDARPLGVIYHEHKVDYKMVNPIGIWLTELLELLPYRLLRTRKEISMLIDNPMRSFAYVESNRMISDRVRSRMDSQGAKVAMITSVFENEGKSTVSANLALGLAMDGKRVLLMDVDLRRPSQYKIFQIDKEKRADLVQIMAASSLRENPATRYKDTGLYLIANDHSARGSDGQVSLRKLKQLIDYYRSQMDYIFLDTSPMALVTDTETMTILADCSILVVREDVVPVSQINDTIDVLNGSGEGVLGCIFNDAHRTPFSDRLQNQSYRGYYGRE